MARHAIRALGVALLVLAFAPVYRLLDVSGEAGYREAALQSADSALGFGTWGTIVTALLASVLAVLLPTERLRGAVAAVVRRLAAPPALAFAAALAFISGTLSMLVTRFLYRGFLTNVDEMASTLHARYLAHGMLAGPTDGTPEFWLIPNTLVVPQGVVSQYPPTHLVAMAAAELAGAPLLLGPVCFAVTVALLALSFDRLLPDHRGVSRVAALLVAGSPLLVFLAGGLLNHLSTGALVAAVLYSSLQARDGSAWWSVAAGLAVGLAVANRPLVGLVLGAVLTLGIWVPRAWSGVGGTRWLAARSAGTVAGGIPIAILLAWYNTRLFGGPTTLGYTAAYGARHGLGLHQDPWGYAYGMREALAFTSVDVVSMGVQLLETPLPITALIGLYLLVGKRFPRGVGVLLAWAFLPVLANGFYWFHTARMLYEAAPAWLALCAIAAFELAGTRSEGSGGRATGLARDACAWALAVAVIGSVGWGTPDRWRSYGWTEESLARLRTPAPPGERAAIVFVHTSWSERTSSILQGAGGMRQDSIISLMRRNSSCRLHRYAAEREELVRRGREVTLTELDMAQVAGTPSDVGVVSAPGGGSVRIQRGESFSAPCARQLSADRFGTVALAPLLWQGDLPGIEEGLPLFVRDLGPERNQALLERMPGRVAFAYTPREEGGPPALVPYDEAMRVLWGQGDASAQALPRS